MDWDEFLNSPSDEEHHGGIGMTVGLNTEVPAQQPGDESKPPPPPPRTDEEESLNPDRRPSVPSSQNKRERSPDETAAKEPSARDATISQAEQKRLVREAVLESIYTHREQKYRQVFSTQCQRHQQQLLRFHANILHPIELVNRVLANWRPKVRNTTQAYIERETRPKRERMRLEATIDYRFMIASFKTGDYTYNSIPALGKEQADTLREMGECLIPIRIELEVDGVRFRDTFTWNIYEPVVTPEAFAMIICQDFKLNPSLFMPPIAQQIIEQIEDFYRFMPSVMDRIELYSQLVMIDTEKMDGYLKHYFNEYDEQQRSSDAIGEKLSHFERELIERLQGLRQKYPHISEFIKAIQFDQPGELRVPIKICVIVNNVQLWDAVEVDLMSTPFRSNIPEVIATSICSDLGLGGEYLTAVAHMIREQMWLYLKCLRIIGYPFDASPILDEEFGQHFLPVIPPKDSPSSASGGGEGELSFGTGVRQPDDKELWTPEYFTMSDSEIERLEKDRERESRRKRRGARGRRAAVVKPDEVDMFGFGLPQTGTQDGGEEQNTFVESNNADRLLFERSAIVLPDMKEPLKTQRNQLNLHLRTKDSTKAAEPWPSATTASGVTVSATSTTGSGGGREHQRRSGRSSGRAAAQAAMENIHAQQREISNNDSPTINFRPAPAQPQLTAAEYMQQLQIHQLLLLRQQQQQQQQQRQRQ